MKPKMPPPFDPLYKNKGSKNKANTLIKTNVFMRRVSERVIDEDTNVIRLFDEPIEKTTETSDIIEIEPAVERKPTDLYLAMESYITAYQRRYNGLKPLIGGKQWAIMKRMMAVAGLETLSKALTQYVQHNDRFFVMRCHDLITAEANLQRLVTEIHLGERLHVQQAEKIENEQHLDQSFEKMLANETNSAICPFGVQTKLKDGDLWKVMNGQKQKLLDN